MRRHFCLLSCVPKISRSPLSFGYCSYSQPSHLVLIGHFQWLLEVSKPALLQLCRCATAQPCARSFGRVWGVCSCRLLSVWGWVLFGVMGSACPEQTGLNLLCSVQGSTSECVHPGDFRVVACRAGVQQTVGFKWQGRTGFLPRRKDVLLEEAAETHFALLLCCDPSCKPPRLSSPSSALLNGLWSSHSPLGIGSWSLLTATSPLPLGFRTIQTYTCQLSRYWFYFFLWKVFSKSLFKNYWKHVLGKPFWHRWAGENTVQLKCHFPDVINIFLMLNQVPNPRNRTSVKLSHWPVG